MAAYYNEIEPFAAAWLTELMKAGLIADGTVDERPIEQVEAPDLAGFAQCHFFAGIGVWSYALRAAGWPDDSPVWTGSCPCQGFSASGKRGGFSDKRHLWPAWFRLIRQCSPNVIFGEQVASKDGLAWLDVVSSDLEGAGYALGAADTCAAGFGAPHIRQRLYFVADASSRTIRRNAREVLGAETSQAGWSTDGYSDGSAASRMADTERAERWPSESRRHDADRQEAGRQQGADRAGESGEIGQLADTESGRPQQFADSAGESAGVFNAAAESPQRLQPASGHSASLGAGDLGHAAQCGERPHNGQSRTGDGQQEPIGRPSLTNGFWADCEWLPCRDGKFRPTQPGLFPLATGSAKRVGRLRGYGNCIVAPQAQGFIEAYLEAGNADGG